MKFDVTVFRFLSDSDLRVLTAVEIGMKNHQLVPTSLICSLCNLRSGFSICLSNLHRYKLIHHDSSHHDCYRLTPLGYDILALRVLLKREAIYQVGNRIGVGKEAEVYQAVTYMSSLGQRLNDEEDGEEGAIGQDDTQLVKVALKFHRLGKVSFRNVKQTRDYLQNRKCKSWLYMSRLAAKREYQVMEELYKRGFQVPEPLECNRHAIVMQLIKSSSTLAQVSKNSIRNAYELCVKLIQFAIRLARHGVIHCDLNEFNILVYDKAPQFDDEEGQQSVHESSVQTLTSSGDPNVPEIAYHTVAFSIIDFPQVVSTSHQLAPYFLQRDIASILQVFSNKFGVDVDAALAEAVGDQLYLFEDSRDVIETTTQPVKLRKIYMDEEDMFSEEEIEQNNDPDDLGGAEDIMGNVDDLVSDVSLGKANQTNDDEDSSYSSDSSEEEQSDKGEDDEDRLGSVDPKFNAMVPIHAMEMFCSMNEVALDVQLEISGYVKSDKAAAAAAAAGFDTAPVDDDDDAEYFSSSEEEQKEQRDEEEGNGNSANLKSQQEKGVSQGKKNLDFRAIASKVRKDRERQQVRKKKNKAALHGANRRETKTQMNHQIEDY